MTPQLSVGRRFGTTVALLAILLSGVSPVLHSEADIAGVRSLEPTAVYYSEHSSDSNEVHLHAETGFELFFCLACILSVRSNTDLHGPLAVLVDIDPYSDVAPSTVAPSLVGTRDLFLSRAPPRV